MIECDCCGDYFHPGDGKICPECEAEVCMDCYSKHVLGHEYDDTEDDYCLDTEDCDDNEEE